MIDRAGLYFDVDEVTYHSDPVVEPSLSASVAKVLFAQSPMHARHIHPRLNPAFRADKNPQRPQEIGTVAHKLILGLGRKVVVIDAKDYKTNAAKDARAAAYAAGDAPILKPDLDAAHAIADAAKRQLQGTELEGVFDAGDAEVTAVWQDVGGVWCRGRIDWLPAKRSGHVIVPDVKTTAGSAHPIEWQRAMASSGNDIQAAFYPRGLKKLLSDVRTVEMRFIVIEQDEPYGLTINDPTGDTLNDAERAIEATLAVWAWCMKSGQWPGYPKRTNAIEAPVYHKLKSEMRTTEYRDLLRRLADWQAPLQLRETA